MICYVLATRKQPLGPHVVVEYGIIFFLPSLFITSPDHQAIVSVFVDVHEMGINCILICKQ